jgi:hypothetical protein
MDWYIEWVSNNVFLSAAIQFGILGTLGEFVSHWFRTKTFSLFCSIPELVAKVIGWALLGIVIKYAFTGMKGFLSNLIETGMFPPVFNTPFLHAFALSTITNTLFGPQMMVFHRIEDNIILRRRGFDGITNAWKTLLWFWIPAHTATFLMPPAFQIGLASTWSLVLGVIMGMTKKEEGSDEDDISGLELTTDND